MTLTEYLKAIINDVPLEFKFRGPEGIWHTSDSLKKVRLDLLVSRFHEFEYREKPPSPVKKKGFMNLYRNTAGSVSGGAIHNSYEEAVQSQAKYPFAVATIPIEWEEPA